MAVIKRPSAPLLSDDQKLDEVPQRSHEDIYQKAEEWGIETNPLDIETLVKRYGIKVVREEMDIDLSGYIEKRQNYWVIGINKYQTSRRQRFTLAHEFAHFLFDKAAIEAGRLTDQIMLRSEEVNPKEQRANEFAAKLLMPKQIGRASCR